MEQQIRYCTTSDGVRIAYAVVGEGPPIIRVQGWYSHLEYEWKSKYWRSLMEVAASEYLRIRYDGRGMGLSDRQVSDFSLEGQVRDLEAVIDALGVERFGLDGISQGGPTAITYAVRHPERVTHLTLYGSFARLKPAGLDLDTEEGRAQFDAMLTLMRHGWGKDTPAFRQMFTGLFMPEADAELIREFNEMQRASTSGETAVALFSAIVKEDVTDLLPRVSVPTLVVHRRGDGIVPFEMGRELATTIPGARFLPLEGNNHAILPHEPELLTTAMEMQDFIQEVIEDEKKRQKSTGVGSEIRSPVEKDLIGRTISHYRVLEKLGEGGMGVVYKAKDSKLGRAVALKFLAPYALGSEEDKLRFFREAKAAALLDHPNICTVYEIDEAGGRDFIAMSYIEGQSLAETLESGPLETDKALDISIQVGEGLRQAHRKGILHRDIKSANIMITEDGQAKIMDFGIAKLAGQSRLTKTATIMGTVAYMSPEQARGDEAIDQRTDIWSLGVVLYEMLSGKRPFDAPSDAALLHKIIYEPEKPLGNIKQGLPVALEQAVLKMLQKDAQDRYADMEAFISDLKAIRAGATPKIIIEEKGIPSIAVLPFVDMSPQKDQEYFCDGISESLINALTQIKDLRVIARTSAFSFKGQSLDVREIGKKLSVGTVLEGSIQKAGERVRVTAQLINTARGEHLWSEKYDRDMKDIFAIQDEISEAIVTKLKPKLLGVERAHLAKRQTVDLEVYNLYLKGRWFWNKRTPDGLEKSIEYFEQAIEQDPDYAMAYAGLADSHIVLPTWTPTRGNEEYSKAKQLSLKALEIDEGLAEAHTSLGFVKMSFDHDWTGAESEYKRALDLNPGYAQAHLWYALLLTAMDRHEEAFEEANTALQLDPLSLTAHIYSGMVFNLGGAYDKTIELIKKAIEMDPGFGMSHMVLGGAYCGKSMYEEALAEYEEEAKHTGAVGRFSFLGLGVAYARMGKKNKVKQLLETGLQESRKKYISPYGIAQLYFSLGENDTGFQWLEKAYDEREITLCFWLRTEPNLEHIRSDPRYRALLDKMNLPKPVAAIPMIEPSPSIAVLPFVNMSADPEQEYFCDGLAEELINALTQIKDLHVVARTSAFSFKGQNIDVRDIGKKLNVETVLEGSVRKAGNRLRITGQLVKVSDGYHLWSDKYDREMEDIFAIQDEITLAIVDNLKPRLLGEERSKLAKRKTIDLEAYNLCLRGRWHWGQFSEEGFQKAFQYFNQAIEKDPQCALAFAGLATVYNALPSVTYSPLTETAPKAREAALKALEIDETLPEAHAALAVVKTRYDWDWSGAEREHRRAIELAPGSVGSLSSYALHLIFTGRIEEAVEKINRALELDPLAPTLSFIAGILFFHAKQYDESMDKLRNTIEMVPDHTHAHAWMGRVYLTRSMYDEAFEEFAREKEISKGANSWVEVLSGDAYMKLGKREKAQELLDDLLKRAHEKTVTPTAPAMLHFLLGENDQCFALMDRAYEERDYWLSYLKIEPLFNSMQSDPRYHELLKKIGLDT